MAGKRHGHGILCVNRPLKALGASQLPAREAHSTQCQAKLTFINRWRHLPNAVWRQILAHALVSTSIRGYLQTENNKALKTVTST